MCVFFSFFGAKIWPAAAGTGELARDLRDQTQSQAVSSSESAVFRTSLVPTGIRVMMRGTQRGTAGRGVPCVLPLSLETDPW